ncbi:MAG: PAS domain S-box protein [Thermaurantimonas sp.]|uniref:PAS domain S-box protein n=1 Tax=Thermaurantimonas sp. TaxID=2681568 RepID=UPI00391CE2CA
MENNKKDIQKSIDQFLSEYANKKTEQTNDQKISENLHIFQQELEYQNNELKRINVQLESKNIFIENLFRIIPSILLLVDENYNIIKRNNAFENSFKLNGELLNDFRKIIANDSQSELYYLLNNTKQRVTLKGINNRLYLADASTTLFNEKNLILLHLTDITELEESKQKIKLENDIKNLLFEINKIHFEETDEDSIIQNVGQKLVNGLAKILSVEKIYLFDFSQSDRTLKFESSFLTERLKIRVDIENYFTNEIDCLLCKKSGNFDSDLRFKNIESKILASGFYLHKIFLQEKEVINGCIFILCKHKLDDKLIDYIRFEILNIFFKIIGESKIYENERKLKAIVENSPDGLAVIENGKLIYATDNYFKITSIPKTDPRWKDLKNIFEYIHPEDRDNVRELILRALANKETNLMYEFRILNIEGKYIWQQDRVNILYLDENRHRLYVTARNITEQKEQLQQLKILEAAIDQSDSSIVITDSAGNIQFVNKAFTKITGYTFEEVKNKNPRILKSGLIPEEEYEKLWSLITSGKSWYGEFINKKKDGSLYSESASITPVIIDGKITNYVAVKNDITSLKELNKKFETLSLVASHTQNIVIITDNTGHIIWVNKSFEKNTGYTFDEVFGKRPGEFLQGKDTNPMHVKTIHKKLKELVPFKQEILNYTKDGRPYWIEMSITPIFDEKGNHTMYIAVEDDITQRKEYERKIIESERKNRAILHALPDLLFIIDKNLRYIDFHAYDPSQILIPPEKFLGKTVMEVMPKQQGEIVSSAINETFRTAELREFIFHLDVKEKRRYYEGRCVLKDVNSVLILIRDITKLKTFEQDLINEKLLFKTVIDHLPNTIYVKDLNFRKILVNKAEVLYLGKTSEEEVLGKTDDEFYTEEVINGIIAEDNEVISTGKPILNKIVEYTNNWAEKKYMMISKLPFRDVNGQIVGIIGIGVDITEIKKKELELQKTINVITDQNRRLRSFTYIVSHNIRSYAANIDGLIDLINSHLISEGEKPEMLKLLKQASSNLMETITTLNEVISIEKKVAEKIQPVELKVLIDKVLNVVNKDITDNQIIVVNNVPDNAKVMFNPAYLESVILNLTTNAIRYRRTNVRSFVKYSFREEKGNKIIEVSDNGKGIDLTKFGSKIFNLFETFHGNPDAKGLGLFLTKAHVEAMGGKIEVESKVGEGTTFRIILKN